MYEMERDMEDAKPLLTFTDVMKRLRVSRSTVYRLIESKHLKGHKVGSCWRFYEHDVKAALVAQFPTKEFSYEDSRPRLRSITGKIL